MESELDISRTISCDECLTQRVPLKKSLAKNVEDDNATVVEKNGEQKPISVRNFNMMEMYTWNGCSHYEIL